MDRHKRIARTLACLVASMTVGAVVLDWFQPGHRTGTSPAMQLIARIRNAIHKAARGDGTSDRWSAIRIEPLAETVEGADDVSHFIVEPDGTWTSTNSWGIQKELGEEGVVRIALRTTGGTDGVTGEQWRETVKLVGSLQKMYVIPGERTLSSRTLSAVRPSSPGKAG